MRWDWENQNPDGAIESARKRNGPDPRISIRARGVFQPQLEAGHTSEPDHTANSNPRKCLHSLGRPHTSGVPALMLYAYGSATMGLSGHD